MRVRELKKILDEFSEANKLLVSRFEYLHFRVLVSPESEIFY